MPAKKPADPKAKPQKERFIEAAKKAGVDADAFERTMDKLTPPRTPKGKA
jgi:hypothetical protein